MVEGSRAAMDGKEQEIKDLLDVLSDCSFKRIGEWGPFRFSGRFTIHSKLHGTDVQALLPTQ